MYPLTAASSERPSKLQNTRKKIALNYLREYSYNADYRDNSRLINQPEQLNKLLCVFGEAEKIDVVTDSLRVPLQLLDEESVSQCISKKKHHLMTEWVSIYQTTNRTIDNTKNKK